MTFLALNTVPYIIKTVIKMLHHSQAEIFLASTEIVLYQALICISQSQAVQMFANIVPH